MKSILNNKNRTERNIPFHLASIICMFIVLVAGALADDDAPASTDPPGNYRILSDDGVATFPFDIFRGDIRFRGEINGREVYMLLDDGFMWDPILFWGSLLVDSLGLEYDGQVDVGGGNEGKAIPSRTASNITISFPGVEFTDQTAVITSYSSGTSNMWYGSVGQVSATFLKHFVVDINFDKMMIMLIEPEKFEYAGEGVAVPWKPMEFGAWSIPGTLDLADGRTISLGLMMDLGYNDQLRITTDGEHKIPVPEPAMAEGLGFNIQGVETLGHVGRLSRVSIGGYEIDDVLAAFVDEEYSGGVYHEAMIGLGLLSHFNLVFDYSRQRLFIEPNHMFGDPFEHNMSGIKMKKDADNNYEIIKVIDGSSAEKAGLKVGDRVIKIDGLASAEHDLWSLYPIMRQSGHVLKLSILRGDSEVEVSLILERII